MSTRYNAIAMMKRLTLGLMLLAVAFTLNSCMKQPVFIGIESVKIGSLNNKDLQAGINFKIYNPNHMGTKLVSSKVKLYYKNKLIGNGETNKEIALPAGDTSVIALASDIDLSVLVGVLPDLLATDSVVFRVEGTSKVKALGINWNIPVKDNVRLNIKPALTQQVSNIFKSDTGFKIKTLTLSKMPGLDKTRFSMLMSVKNSFNFEYRVLHMNLEIYRRNGSRSLASWKLADSIDQQAGKTTDIPVTVEVNNLNLLSETRLTDLFHPDFNFTFKGEAIIAINNFVFTIPIEQTRKINLNTLESNF